MMTDDATNTGAASSPVDRGIRQRLARLLAFVPCYAAYWIGCAAAVLIERVDWLCEFGGYRLYSWCMRQSLEWSDRFSIGLWRPAEKAGDD